MIEWSVPFAGSGAVIIERRAERAREETKRQTRRACVGWCSLQLLIKSLNCKRPAEEAMINGERTHARPTENIKRGDVS